MIIAIFILIGVLLMSLYGFGFKFQEWEKQEDVYKKEIKLLREAFYIACKEKSEATGKSMSEASGDYLNLAREKVKNENNNQFLY